MLVKWKYGLIAGTVFFYTNQAENDLLEGINEICEACSRMEYISF